MVIASAPPTLLLTRVGANCLIAPILADLGHDPAAISAGAGVDLAAFSDPEAVVPVPELGRFIAAAIAASGRRDLGLLVAERAGNSFVGVLLNWVAETGTLGRAVRKQVELIAINTRTAVARLVVEDELAAFELTAAFPDEAVAAVIEDGIIAITVCSLRSLVGERWRPAGVEFLHAPTAPRLVYERLLGCRAAFNRPRSAVLIAAADLDRPLITPAAAAPAATPAAAARRLGLGLEDRARAAIRARLADPGLDRAAIAEALGLSSRTFNRRLAAQGLSFAALLQDTRYRAARQLLAGSETRLGPIALALGYPDQSAFSRAFKSWSGLAPRAWRAAHRK